MAAQKVGNRAGLAGSRRSGGATQRQVRRRRRNSGEIARQRMGLVLSYVPTILKAAAAIVIGVLIFAGYRAAATASFFQVRLVDVQGTSHASAEEVQALVRREVSRLGVWQADLPALRAKLERLPWIRTAIVSRVLPDKIRVRIAERVPRVVVHTSGGRFRWVDDDAVLLGEMLPTDQMSSFFLRGWSDEESEAARKDNIDRVKKFLELQRDWDAAGLSERVSEVNLIDIRDVRAQLAGDNSQVEVRLGADNFGPRLKQALELLDQQRDTPLGPLITYIIMNQKNPIVGHSLAVHNLNKNGDATEPRPRDDKRGTIATRDNPAKALRERRSPPNLKPEAKVKNPKDKRGVKAKGKEDRSRRH